MSKKKRSDDEHKNDPQKGDDGFGLIPPTGEVAQTPKGDRPVSRESQLDLPQQPKADAGEFKQMAWKGFEEEEVDPDPMIQFGEKGNREEDELDMTPMVDVTFLLLIFFMVTASFTLQKSIEQPPANVEDPSTVVIEDPEEEDDYVEVVIDQGNTYYVTSREEEQVECPSDREMRARMRDAKELTNVTRLIIRAHVDSLHKKVVTVWDAGISVGMDRIEIKTTDEDF